MGMYGLENKNEGPKLDLAFDLEKEMKRDPAKRAENLKKVEERTQKAKNLTVQGGSLEELHQAEVLLKGFTALKKVLDRVKK